MGSVVDDIVDIGKEVIEATIDVAKSVFGSSRHSSGPTLTYNRRNAWDQKRNTLQNKRKELEKQREPYVENSNRLQSVSQRREKMQQRLLEARQKLEQTQCARQKENERLQEERKKNACEAVLSHWVRMAQNAVESIHENCPQLKQLTEELAENNKQAMQQKWKSNLQAIQKYRSSQIEEKKARQLDYQEILDQRKKLAGIIDNLSQLQENNK